MFYDNLKAECDRQGLKLSPLVVECGGAVGSISGWKNGAYPNSEIVIKLALRLNVTADYLLTGKEKSSSSDLSEEEQECLQKFKNLSPIDRGRILERMETMLNSYTPEQKENVS